MPALYYPGPLPAGALVRADPVRHPCLHFRADAALSLARSETGVVAWQSTPPGPATARPVAFNQTGTGDDARRGALCFSDDRHAGLVIDQALPQGAPFSLALILRATAPEPRTIVTLQTLGAAEYLFLSGEDGGLRLAGKTGGEVARLPDPGGLMLVTLAFSARASRIAVNGDAPLSHRALALPGPVGLFLGCRGDARSLRNKTGCFDLFDLLIWPGKDVLDGAGAAPDQALQLWQERRGHGL